MIWEKKRSKRVEGEMERKKSGEGDRRLKYKKAAREYGVANEVWKYGGKSLRRATWEEEWYGKGWSS